MTRKRAIQTLGTVLAVCVPAIVVAQATFTASRSPFGQNDPVTATALNLGAANTCKVVVNTGATAQCPSDFVVLGGGCRTGAPGQNLRGFGPGFSSGAFPDPDAFEADLFANGSVTNRGGGAPSGANPQWDMYGCEPQAGGTIQATYALCCPLTPAQ